ncbi:MAG: AMP-binding protein [Muribaculaceae bacterium]|nr:AMP-binding protein [Muribaculaceae bacterium]
MTPLPLLQTFEKSLKDNYLLPALTDYVSGKTITYGEFAAKIAHIHILYKAWGIRRGDKVAILGKNTSEWVSVFMATLTYGAVIVPILNDFNPLDAQHIVNHSEARLLFVNESIFEHMDFSQMPKVEAAVSLDRSQVLEEASPDSPRSFTKAFAAIPQVFKKVYRRGFTPEDIKYPKMDPDDLGILNYTSGTTGFSKGVMLTHNNINGNVQFGVESRLHYKGSRALSFLPLAHAYGCAFDMLVPLAVGSHITILGKTPTPHILVKALAKVKPSLIICVPLILEKIYRKMIAPMLAKKPLSWVLAVPLLDKAVYSRIRARLVEVFGGEFEEVIVGGAPLNPEVEDFLHKIKFPFTVGYGMTECGPLISYTPWREFIPTSSGHTLRGIMTARIGNIDGDIKVDSNGEILVKGQNVMKGYYKNPEATEAVLDPDGWLHTGDMGYLGGDDGQTIFIRGRYKTMILSANGQNIYPEEIEAKLNNMPFVAESLVVERNGHLVALVYPDIEEADSQGYTLAQLEEYMNERTRTDLNTKLAPYEKIEKIQLMPQEFEKTPKRSIRRFLYK